MRNTKQKKAKNTSYSKKSTAKLKKSKDEVITIVTFPEEDEYLYQRELAMIRE